ncbi:tetratricopeptide repeat protein [Candidatus Thiodictyon syntrophicum]|uniref:tetratricopeptide repeat protein n=1 Tax=Candidatus Thiodictyon syntrophicum TaxID=1166950 RepID=UPI001C12B654|nr:tetratricopeptide repeat protein [Candidatus Thiodictyon syntrophicum]
MPKKPSKTDQAKGRQPESAQLKAVERLLEARDFTRAVMRARALVQRFPDHGAANRMLVEALDQAGSAGAATLAAYQWAHRRPNSQAAQEALVQFAGEGGYPLLVVRAADRLADLGAIAEPIPADPAVLDGLMQQPDGSHATREDLERVEIGQIYMAVDDFAAAVRELDGVATTPARNNRALALFHSGRSEEALAATLDAWQQDPGNLCALGLALQLRFYRGDETGARALAVPLAQAQARRAEDAQAQLGALLLIREDQAAWDAFERSNQADWSDAATGVPEAMRLLFGAGAASRLGRGDQARDLWQRALAQHPGLASARENLAILERDGVPPLFPALFALGRAFPMGVMGRIHETGAAALESRINRLGMSDHYLEALYLTGDLTVRGLAAYLLQRRLGHAVRAPAGPTTRPAATILRDLARLPIGTIQERLGFINALRQRKLLAANEAVECWDGTGLQEVTVFSTAIHRETVSTGLPTKLQTRLEESMLQMRAHLFEAAEANLNAILARVPDHPTALGNLAALRGQQGRTRECRDLLRRVIAAHPDYLFARCNLASILIPAGELDEAQGLLDGLAQRPRLHLQEVFELYGVLAMLSRARGDERAAATLIASLEQLAEQPGDERWLALAKVRVERALPQGRINSTVSASTKGSAGAGRPKRR